MPTRRRPPTSSSSTISARWRSQTQCPSRGAHAKFEIDRAFAGRERLLDQSAQRLVVGMHHLFDFRQRQARPEGESEHFEHRARPCRAAAHEIPIPEAAASPVERQFDMRALDRLARGPRAGARRIKPVEAERTGEHQPGRGEQRRYDPRRFAPGRERVGERRGERNLAGRRREIANRGQGVDAFADFDAHYASFLAKIAWWVRRAEHRGQRGRVRRPGRFARHDRPLAVREQRLPPTEVRVSL